MFDVFLANTDADYDVAASLFREYAAELPIALDFQHFEEELNNLKNIYNKNYGGGIVLCKVNQVIIGCAGIRKFNNEIAELKRMWISPSERGKGFGNKIIKAALALAISENYKAVVLDTLNHMHAAIKIYRGAGFKETEAYYFNPHKDALYFKKILS